MNKLVADDLSLLAYQRIKKMILENRLEPGKKIVQEKLAAELGISRTPLRTALQMLEAEYLVKSIPRRGMVVREFSNREIAEVYDCRIALECTAVRLFAEQATKEQIDELKQLFKPFVEKVAGSINTKAYQKADSKFHDALIKYCGNGFLHQLFNQGNLLIWINRIGLIRPPEETLPEHLAIVDALEEGAVEKAESLAKIHLEKSKHLILNLIADEER
ncbi:MAG: GntR family transcriptional regulator [Saprospiraceae bacterium]|nr:GntR family transcriptional regulator [Saprospiraceae bacterium]